MRVLPHLPTLSHTTTPTTPYTDWGIKPPQDQGLPFPLEQSILFFFLITITLLGRGAIGYFLYLHFKCFPLSRSPLWKLPSHPKSPTHPPTPILLSWHSPTLRHQTPSGPRASPPTDVQQGHSLPHMWPASWAMFILWLVVQSPGAPGGGRVRPADTVAPSTGLQTPLLFQSLLQLLHWGPPGSVQWLTESICLCICQALAELLRRQPYQGFHQQAPPDIHNSVQVWCLYVGWIPRWSSLWMAFPLVFALSISPSLGFFLYIVGFSASMASWHLVLMGLFSLYSPSCNKLKCLQALPPVLKGVECVSS
jgi:hypothetical protein